MTKHVVFDVESIGLHGEGFAAGWVVLEESSGEFSLLSEGFGSCPPETADGDQAGRLWVAEHVCLSAARGYPLPRLCLDPVGLRDWFWEELSGLWQGGANLWADVPWPVEARFLHDCVEDEPSERRDRGPYPLLDVCSFKLAVTRASRLDAGQDSPAFLDQFRKLWPLEPKPISHHPLADARFSAVKLIHAIREAK